MDKVTRRRRAPADAFKDMGRLTAKYIHDAIKPLADRVAALEAAPSIPPIKFVGVWVAPKEYTPGNVASYAGSMWHCNVITTDKPGTSSAWTLCVKRGRDGKDTR